MFTHLKYLLIFKDILKGLYCFVFVLIVDIYGQKTRGIYMVLYNDKNISKYEFGMDFMIIEVCY